MKEDEASTKECVMRSGNAMIAHAIVLVNCNKDKLTEMAELYGKATYCLGARCMMWRETRTGEGHCGLAGKE